MRNNKPTIIGPVAGEEVMGVNEGDSNLDFK